MNTNSTETQPLACDLTAIPSDVREEHVVSAPQLFAAAQKVQELPDGYAIRFVNDPGRFMSIAKFIENERLCCPFFRFELEIEPNSGPIWLRLTGAEGVKDILRSVLLESRGDMAEFKKAIHTGDDPKLDAIIAATPFPVLPNVAQKDSPE
ncbi:MAG TPA: hypothetical protein VK880_03665 [Anaerolineales bacterium]|nr:hypothetical protein [Anaerolineales bacterium]